ncbi:MAG: XdhC family protein [Ferrovum sp.]|nr:XdhC family protein [Ferrovum sp.]
MDSTDLEVLKTVTHWQSAGVEVALATLTRTWGSAPRPVGSLLALTTDGRLVGSLSGGCIEDDLLTKMRQSLPLSPEKMVYGVTAEQASRFGLPCGGTLELVLEPLHPQSKIPELLDAVSRQQVVARVLNLQNGQVAVVPANRTDALICTETQLRSVHGPRWRLLIIGAGQVSSYLAEMAMALDYQVLVCDPRLEFQKSWQMHVPAVDAAMPDDFIVAQRPDPHTAIVALTHDLKQDDLALLEALKSSAFYVGALGSKATQAKRRERLTLFDLSAAQIATLHGPAGLPIGSRTPPEMAISILAEITAVRHGVQ